MSFQVFENNSSQFPVRSDYESDQPVQSLLGIWKYEKTKTRKSKEHDDQQEVDQVEENIKSFEYVGSWNHIVRKHSSQGEAQS